MALEYDEIRITTRREIVICEKAIKKLEMAIKSAEDKYSLDSRQFLHDFDPGADPVNMELIEWHDNCLALERWKKRLSAHWQIMEL